MSVSGVLASDARFESRAATAPTRLLVTWRNPVSRTYHAVGFLGHSADGFVFTYLERAASLDGFRPFLGFSNLYRRYESQHLFPLFRERLMDSARPDLDEWLVALGLARGATEFEMLARSGGARAGDTIELVAQPSVGDDGRTSTVFLVHGVSHLPGAADRIADLQTGDELLLIDDETNPINPRAVLVAATDRRLLGWVPEPLLEYVRLVRSASESRLTVVRANGPEVGPRLRLLVRLGGGSPDSCQPFTGPDWQTLS